MELPDPQAGPANPVHDSVLTLSVRGGGGGLQSQRLSVGFPVGAAEIPMQVFSGAGRHTGRSPLACCFEWGR